MDNPTASSKRSGGSSNPVIQTDHLSRMRGGWWIGNFEPSVLKTAQFEVAYKVHRQGEDWPLHFQHEATEYNLLVEGQLQIDEQVFQAGDIFIIRPKRLVKPLFLTNCALVVVKVPSLPQDKETVMLVQPMTGMNESGRIFDR